MNSQIMENVIQYYLHVYDSAQRIYSQNKSEYRTANYLYCTSVFNVFCTSDIDLRTRLKTSSNVISGHIFLYTFRLI